MRGRAFAKINFGLEVGRLRRDGLHELRGLFQSIDWHDGLSMSHADEDSITSPSGGPVIDEWDNLAWRAAAAVRKAAGATRRLALELDKRIPVAAGLGGGSADAAAALALAGRLLGVDRETQMDLGRRLGSDVPFCLVGGTAIVSDAGAGVTPVSPLEDFAVAVVVPPVELSTARVFDAFDRLEDARRIRVDSRALPPALRDYAPLGNDLYAAAVSVSPLVEDWRDQLARIWDRPVLMTGSGPSLFAFFVDEDEAISAAAEAPTGARAARGAIPVDRGWVIADE